MTISEQIVQLGWKTGRGAPKADGGARIVALDADTTEVLQEHRDQQRTERAAWGEGWVHSGLVFTERTAALRTPPR